MINRLASNIRFCSKLFMGLVCMVLHFNLDSVVAQTDASNEFSVEPIDGSQFRTIRAFVTGNDLSYPSIPLDGDQTLTFMFDGFGTQAITYFYQIIYCNADWSISDLFSDEYMDGFVENPVLDYHFSVNTTVPYVNYQVKLPNDDVRFKISGNYLLRVFDNQNKDQILLIKRFVVYESLVRIDAQVLRPLGTDIRDNSQEISLKVIHDELPIADPFSEVKVNINQNNRPDRVISNLKPVFIRNNELDYQLPGQNLFTGSNEFRLFDFSDKSRSGLNVNDVRYIDTIYHIQLRLDEARTAKKYFWEEDMNGKYLVNLSNSNYVNESADYAYVHCYLPMSDPFIDGSVYVLGGFCQWQLNKENKMTYNYDQKYYETVLLLKQGYYNYFYTKVDNYTGQPDELLLEGSHFQTENDYLIYVYHRGFGQKYDRLVGYQVINSKYQN